MDANFKQAICTSCGAEIMLDPARRNSFCANCGSRISAADSISKFEKLFPGRVKKAAGAQPNSAGAGVSAEPKPAEAGLPEAGLPEADLPDTDFQEADPGGAEPAEEVISGNPLRRQYEEAKRHLEAREYVKASDIYNKILAETGPMEHEAHWGLFLVDERNFNPEEKLLQCFACFPFRQGYEQIKQEILNNGNFLRACEAASADERAKYALEAQRHAENIYTLFREGCDNLLPVAERHFGSICHCYETIGIYAAPSRVSFPAGVSIRFMGDSKLYLRFSLNKLNMLHIDVYDIAGQPTPAHTLWHYRHALMVPDTGRFAWSEFRVFSNANEPERVSGELDPYHKESYFLLGMWDKKIIVKNAGKVFFMRAIPQPESVTAVFESCYQLVCVPLVEDPQSYSTGHKVSEFYKVQPIQLGFDTSKRSRWIRRTAGCFVATAVYGGYDTPQVLSLRHFRDDRLARSAPGRGFIALYYRAGPFLARFMRTKKNGGLSRAGRAVRSLLDRFVNYIDKSD